MPPKFVPMPLPPVWLRQTPVKSIKPTGVIYAVPTRNWSGDSAGTLLAWGLAGAAAGEAAARLVDTGALMLPAVGPPPTAAPAGLAGEVEDRASRPGLDACTWSSRACNF